MNEVPQIAVCIPTFNQAAYLTSTIESALQQVGVETHLYISDDASTDGTRRILKRYTSNERVNIITNSRNLGMVGNTLQVMEIPRQTYIIKLDSDDILYPDYCREQALLLDRFPLAAVAHCGVDQIDQVGQITGRRRLARTAGFKAALPTLKEAVYGYKVAANICMFRSKALWSLPFMYNTNLSFAEDWDLFVRLADAGWGNVYNSKILAAYRVWSDEMGVRSRRKEAEIRAITHVLCNSIEPAWRARGWSPKGILSARQRFALAHLDFVKNGHYDLTEKNNLDRLLVELAGTNIEQTQGTPFALRSSKLHQLACLMIATFKRLMKSLLFR